MGTWSTLDTVLAILAVIGIAGSVWFYRQSRRTTEVRGAVSLSATPTVGQTESALKAAELADRLRIINENQAIVAQTLVALLARSDATAFRSIKDKESLKRHSETLVELAKSALSDVRRMMDVSEQGFTSMVEWPTLDSITQLFADVEEQGLIINFEESGDRFPMSTSAELAVFRIITEAIDNSRIHGGVGTEVDVMLTWGPHGLTITINDDGERALSRRAAETGEELPEPVTIEIDHEALIEKNSGRGLIEMKSRAVAFGGVIHAQRVPGAGFKISASFPMLRYATDPKPNVDATS